MFFMRVLQLFALYVTVYVSAVCSSSADTTFDIATLHIIRVLSKNVILCDSSGTNRTLP
jgi:hypothetical protein